MIKQLLVGVLSLSVVGAGGAAVANEVVNPDTSADEAIPVIASESVEAFGQELAQGPEGDPWWAAGTIVELDDFGMTLRTQQGDTYVELGPPDYWQEQGVQLAAGQIVTVMGSISEGMVHAFQVQLEDGQVLRIRTETGQPLWAGGIDNGQGQNAASGDGEHTPDPQAMVDEWITVEGKIIAYQNGNMTLSTLDGELLSFQSGQPRFMASQGVTFQIDDAVSVVGFYAESGEFVVGDITQLETGLRVMLRDPNGRPLWSGSSNNGNGNGNGNGKGQAQ